ncbi:ABC transporter ATP-binding protein [Anaerobaca lacustris]|uniref:ABC transporter ATP-binding protein n=1 Tax=Anaerobaca lacustris TaxID=3044600 RepID=A0AAW6TWE5_9BACT|nr:ABC transporter ATP-binding protein [Sedimentisphaerales bacterium M17dextr]
MAVISVSHISKTFDRVCAVCDLSFAVEAGSCFGLLGPNGAGKTTMMKMIYGKAARDKKCSGAIEVFGFDPARDELAIKYLSGVVPQENNLDEELNVVQNLLVYAKFYGLARRVARERIESLLAFLELSEKAGSKIRELSGGMKRRLVIARALLNEPRLLILDEPTTGLDPQVRHLIWEKLRRLRNGGTTILLTTHYMEEAFQICDRVLIMDKGRKVMEDQPQRLMEQNIERYVLEVSQEQAAAVIGGRELPAAVRADDAQGISRFYSDDLDGLKVVAAMLDGHPYYLRQANLEDVFLKATGRALNEKQ